MKIDTLINIQNNRSSRLKASPKTSLLKMSKVGIMTTRPTIFKVLISTVRCDLAVTYNFIRIYESFAMNLHAISIEGR